MPYLSYKDKQKTKIVKASEIAVTDKNTIFYCKTDNCDAQLKIVNVADENRAYFRRLSSQPKHCSIQCSADGFFDPTKYREAGFNFNSVALNLMTHSTRTSDETGTGVRSISGGGGIKSISRLLQIYTMCRKCEIYNGQNTSNILADERNYAIYSKGITGIKVVQCTYYHKFHNEFSLKMNYPFFPTAGKYLKLNFSSEALFWYFFNKLKNSNHKELIAVLGDWKTSSNECISECMINTKKQIHILKH